MWTGSTMPTRLAKPSHVDWTPEPYQQKAVAHLLGRLIGGLALDPGLGKTSCTLGAFAALHNSGHARTMLVIAPLRVCRHVWRQEASKWSQFKHLRFAFLHGAKKEQLLRDGLDGNTDVFLINPEGVRWLCNLFFGRPLPFDVVCIDELTRFKNSQADRFKALAPRIASVKRKWGLTGSLAPNGYMDLFGQMLILDAGAALGRFITHYRDTYFQVGYDGFSYDLLPGADKRIVQKIGPYWLQMTAEDYIKLPPLVERLHELEMEPAERKVYTRMKNDMLAELPQGVVEAGNMAACYAKLSQMANGAVYLADRTVAPIHDAKLEALDEIVEELNGQPVLVGFEFQHDLARLKEWHQKRFGKPLPYLGDGQSEAAENEVIRRWNAGELPVLAAHPASAGHGLNMQESSAAHLVWFGITWDFELFDQFIRRIRRRGNDAQRIFMHLLVVKGTIDELKLQALHGKDMTQKALFVALNQVLHDDGAGATQESSMVSRLSSRGDAPQGGQQAAQGGGWGQGGGQPQGGQQGGQPQGQQGGWGQQGGGAAGGGWGGQPQGDQGQRQAVQEAISPRESVRGAFTGGVQQQADQIANGDYGPVDNGGQQGGWGQQGGQPQGGQQGGWGNQQRNDPPFDGGQPAQQPATEAPKRSRSRKAADPAPVSGGSIGADPTFEAQVRLQLLTEVLKTSPDSDVKEVIEITEELAKYVLTGEVAA